MSAPMLAPPPPRPRAAPAPDWRTAIPERRRRWLRRWLAAGAATTFAILVIGGITRLTQSGLSIVDWKPLMGAIPPLSEADWQAAFDRYREFPEYRQLRRGMSMEEFRFIFFWEYLHRLAARAVGVLFLVPFLVFWRRGWLAPPLLRRLGALFLLGAAQGVMGWLMVKSGLVDRPSVSHYRLAAHLSIALAILGTCVWLIRDLSVRPGAAPERSGRGASRWVWALGALLALQVVWGAFVAGLKAGRIFNSFPLMAGRLVPPDLLRLEPALRNFVENPFAVQWVHRVLGTVLLVAALAAAARMRREEAWMRGLALAFAGLVAAQYALGVATLLLAVPVSLGVLHQAMAAVVLAVWVMWAHRARGGAPAAASPRVGLPAERQPRRISTRQSSGPCSRYVHPNAPGRSASNW